MSILTQRKEIFKFGNLVPPKQLRKNSVSNFFVVVNNSSYEDNGHEKKKLICSWSRMKEALLPNLQNINIAMWEGVYYQKAC